MKQPYLAWLTSFGPMVMVIGQSRPRGDVFWINVLLGVLPFIGALMVVIGVTLLVRVVQTHHEELADLRTKLESLDRK